MQVQLQYLGRCILLRDPTLASTVYRPKPPEGLSQAVHLSCLSPCGFKFSSAVYSDTFLGDENPMVMVDLEIEGGTSSSCDLGVWVWFHGGGSPLLHT